MDVVSDGPQLKNRVAHLVGEGTKGHRHNDQKQLKTINNDDKNNNDNNNITSNKQTQQEQQEQRIVLHLGMYTSSAEAL